MFVYKYSEMKFISSQCYKFNILYISFQNICLKTMSSNNERFNKFTSIKFGHIQKCNGKK